MNTIQLFGYLGLDPQVRYTPKGDKRTQLRIATHQGAKTIWWNAIAKGDRFDSLVTLLKKGGALVVTGEMLPPEIYMSTQNEDSEPRIRLSIEIYSLSLNPYRKKPGNLDPPNTDGEPLIAEGLLKMHPKASQTLSIIFELPF